MYYLSYLGLSPQGKVSARRATGTYKDGAWVTNSCRKHRTPPNETSGFVFLREEPHAAACMEVMLGAYQRRLGL